MVTVTITYLWNWDDHKNFGNVKEKCEVQNVMQR